MSELSGYDESGKKVAVGVEKPDGEKQGAIKVVLYYRSGGKWIPYDGS